jgi:hypothetical protein
MASKKRMPTMRAPVANAMGTRSAALSSAAPLFSRGNTAIAKLFRKAVDDEPCPKCAGKIRRKADRGLEPDTVPPIVYEVLRSPGQPLDDATRIDMEQRFGGADFSDVRIHTDAQAADSAEAVNARAYTVGKDVVFGRGRYETKSVQGRRLLAHELAHVEPLSSSLTTSSLSIVPSTHPKERNAEKAAVQVTSGLPLSMSASASLPDGLLRSENQIDNPSRRAKPKDAPRGTKPIDQVGLDTDDVHEIKDGVGAGPRDWVGITPNGNVITSDEGGNAVDHGPMGDYLPSTKSGGFHRMIESVPRWLLYAIGAAAMVALIACFATGYCEIGAILAGASASVEASLMWILRGLGLLTRTSLAGNRDSNTLPQNQDQSTGLDPEANV